MNFRRIIPEVGKTYMNRNGSSFICKSIEGDSAVMERIFDGWVLKAHGVCEYEDGVIEWDYATRGHWKRQSER